MKLAVIGIGGHAAEICSYIQQMSSAGALTLLGCIDDHAIPGQFGDLEILGNFRDLGDLIRSTPDAAGITATADNVLRRMIVARAEALTIDRAAWWTLIHPHASVAADAWVGEGTCIAPGAIVTARARIGRHCILNVKASVSHDATIGDYVNLNPGVVVAGRARISDGCYIGAGATVIDKVSIGQGTVVGAGAVVVDDLPANVTAVGVPARVIKYNTSSWEPALIARRA